MAHIQLDPRYDDPHARLHGRLLRGCERRAPHGRNPLLECALRHLGGNRRQAVAQDSRRRRRRHLDRGRPHGLRRGGQCRSQHRTLGERGGRSRAAERYRHGGRRVVDADRRRGCQRVQYDDSLQDGQSLQGHLRRSGLRRQEPELYGRHVHRQVGLRVLRLARRGYGPQPDAGRSRHRHHVDLHGRRPEGDERRVAGRLCGQLDDRIVHQLLQHRLRRRQRFRSALRGFGSGRRDEELDHRRPRITGSYAPARLPTTATVATACRRPVSAASWPRTKAT